MLAKNIIQPINDEHVQFHGISAAILRLDLLHPIVSGNKIFKLNHYLAAAKKGAKKGILTFGGAFSNHLVAAAYAAKLNNLESIGYVRGEKPKKLSHSLLDCMSYGMQLEFTPRESFDSIDPVQYSKSYPGHAIIPHGGYGRLGMLGAKDIMEIPGVEGFDRVIAACGTGTMAAGLIAGLQPHQQLTLVSVLKNNFSVMDEIKQLLFNDEIQNKRFDMRFDFHLGGYAKTNALLFQSMNDFFNTHHIPTDFVYTGKLVHAFYRMMEAGAFARDSKILLIHSGGLQGNRSLVNNELIF
jgi:1-aminocyclopropane-1-carboxylate deaminase/D-cysteine desulfhydrase-like pyridoxal-dependent ACC family enzyme